MKKIKDILLEDNAIPEVVNHKAEEAFLLIRQMRELDGEELADMRKNRKKQDEKARELYHFRYAKVAAAVVCATLLLGTSVYAAEHYWNISSYLKNQKIDVPKEAVEKLIDTEVSQQPSMSESQSIDFAVQEALTDGDIVYLTVEAKLKEEDKGKYFMIPEWFEPELDSVSELGIDSDVTANEYAKQQGVELLAVGSSVSTVKNGLDMASQSIDCKYEGEDTLVFFIHGEKDKKGDNLKATVINTVRPLFMDYEEYMQKKDEYTSTIDFTLKNKSGVDGRNYAMEEDTKIEGTTIEVTKLTVEETELATYVTIQFTQDEKEVMEKAVAFRLKDSKGQRIEESRDGDGGIVQLSKGHYQTKLKYDKGILPDAFMIDAFDVEGIDPLGEEKPSFDQIKAQKQ